jgi:hypothetical protein
MPSTDEVSAKAREWQRRHDAACAIVARKYCDIFEFWRDCRYKPCRAAKRCSGDQGACLTLRLPSVSYEAGIAARARVKADTPKDADRFARLAHHYAHHSLCLQNVRSAKMQAKVEAELQARRQAGPQAQERK